ncbi:MAG TPA: tRNA lysidine(34) synthetase TilS [Acidimicrobiales bacterium]
MTSSTRAEIAVAPSASAGLDRAVLLDHPIVAALVSRTRFADAGYDVERRTRIGLSGGPDSTALAVLSVAEGLKVEARLVDHGLRDTTADRSAAAVTCERLGIPLDVVAVDVHDGPDLEARLRAARHHALGPDAALGHTADDRAETLLLNLMRGTGLAGLTAMSVRHRPLIELRRTETAELCGDLDLPIVVDPTNGDPRHRRNRVRNELLPLLSDIAERDVATLLARTAAHLEGDAALLDSLAGAIDPTDVDALRQAPRPLAVRSLRKWLSIEAGDGYPPDASAIERVLAVVDGAARGTEVCGHRVARRRGRLRIEEISTRPRCDGNDDANRPTTADSLRRCGPDS